MAKIESASSDLMDVTMVVRKFNRFAVENIWFGFVMGNSSSTEMKNLAVKSRLTRNCIYHLLYLRFDSQPFLKHNKIWTGMAR